MWITFISGQWGAQTLQASRNQNNSWVVFQATNLPMNAYSFQWQLPVGGRSVQEVHRTRI